mmetsp:Transcript_19029/g.48841  ORF Transcript_19029/g.48841 Transcript_19029/m.48841 type:complete len:257 (-) Transcript_19029:81-851(-)
MRHHAHALWAVEVRLGHHRRGLAGHPKGSVLGERFPVHMLPAAGGNHKLELALGGVQRHLGRPHVAILPLHADALLQVPAAQHVVAADQLHRGPERHLLPHAKLHQLCLWRLEWGAPHERDDGAELARGVILRHRHHRRRFTARLDLNSTGGHGLGRHAGSVIRRHRGWQRSALRGRGPRRLAVARGGRRLRRRGINGGGGDHHLLLLLLHFNGAGHELHLDHYLLLLLLPLARLNNVLLLDGKRVLARCRHLCHR